MKNTRLKVKHFIPNFNFGAILYVVMIFFGLVLFQNCSDPVSLSEQDKASYSDNLPFAFEAKMDTFAYMSCADMTEPNYDRRAVFNFRLGAYEKTSGVMLADSFKQRTRSFSLGGKVETLQRSPESSGSIMQLAARPTRADLQRIAVNNGNSGVIREGEDLGNYFGGAPLSSPKIAEKLAALDDGQTVNYMSGIPGLDGRLMESSLRYPSVLKQITDQFNQRELMLAVTYTPEADPRSYAARTPDVQRANSVVYGKKYVPDFRGVRRKYGATSESGFRGYWQPSGSVIENRTVVAFRETDMVTNASHDWSCPGDLRLVVTNPFDSRWTDTDPNNDPCPRNAAIATFDDPSSLSARDQKRLEVIRRVLRVEDYYVNLQQNCVAPKDSKNSCYPKPTTDGSISVNINYARGSATSFTCNDDPTAGTYTCPNYISICVRDPLPN